MTAERPYRDTMSIGDVLGILEKERGRPSAPKLRGHAHHLDTAGYTPRLEADAAAAIDAATRLKTAGPGGIAAH